MLAGISLISASLLLNREAQNLVNPTQHPSTAPWWTEKKAFSEKGKLPSKTVDSDFMPLEQTYPVTALEKDILEYFCCSDQILFCQKALAGFGFSKNFVHQKTQKYASFLTVTHKRKQ